MSNKKNQKSISHINEEKKKKPIISINYFKFPVVENEEESDYYFQNTDDNYKKNFPNKSEVSHIYNHEENEDKKNSRNNDASVGVEKNVNEEIDLIITNEKNNQISCPTNNELKNKDNNEYSQNKNYPFYPNKINNLIKEESKIKYINKNKIIIGKNKMNVK